MLDITDAEDGVAVVLDRGHDQRGSDQFDRFHLGPFYDIGQLPRIVFVGTGSGRNA